MDKSEMLDAIKKHYKFKTDKELADYLEVKASTLSMWHKRNAFDIELIFKKFEDLNPKWLLTGKGPMIIPYEDTFQSFTNQSGDYESLKKAQNIPVINVELCKTLNPRDEKGHLIDKFVIDWINAPDLPSVDAATHNSGDSMSPIIQNNDLIAYKLYNLNNVDIFYGEIYILVINIDENTTYNTTKYVHKSDLGKEYLKLTPHNPMYGSVDVPKKQISEIALVRASLRILN